MQPDRIQDVPKFFVDLGGLHDAKVLKVMWTPELSEFAISVDDLRANFAGLPEHGGVRPATLVFGAVSRLSVAGDTPDPGAVRLFDVECSIKPNAVALLLSPSGRIEVDFGTLTVN